MLAILLTSFATLFVGILARQSERTWAAPAATFALMWAVYILSGLLFVTRGDELLGGMLWIAANVLVLYFGTLVARSFWSIGSTGGATLAGSDDAMHDAAGNGRLRMLRWFAAAPIVLGILAAVGVMTSRGFSASDIVSFAAIAQVSSASHGAIYSGDEDSTPAPLRAVFILLFFGALYGGMLVRLSPRRLDRAIGIGTLGVITFVYTLLGSRVGVLFGGSFWLASFLATHVYLTRGDGRADRTLFKLALGGTGILLGLSMMTMAVRYVATDDLDWYKILADPFTFVAAFGTWFHQTGFHVSDLLLGARTFRRPLQLLGYTAEMPPAIDVGATSSNIYTVFRDLLEDFGSFGALGAIFLFGVLGRWAFVTCASRRIAGVPWLTFFYAFTITSFAAGMLSYTGPTVALAAFAVTFFWVSPFPRRADVPAALEDT